VTTSALCSVGKPIVPFEHPAKLASSRQRNEQLVVILENEEILIFSSSVRTFSSFEIDLEGASFTAVAIASRGFVVASFNEEWQSGQIFILDMDCCGHGKEIAVPCFVDALVVPETETEVFCGSRNGAVFRLEIDEKGLTGNICYIHFGSGPVVMADMGKGSIAFSCAGKLSIYNNGILFDSQLEEVSQIIFRSGSLFLIQSDKFCSVDPALCQLQPSFFETTLPGPIAQMAQVGDVAFGVVENAVIAISRAGSLAHLEIMGLNGLAVRKKRGDDYVIAAVANESELVVLLFSGESGEFAPLGTRRFKDRISGVESYQNLFFVSLSDGLRVVHISHNNITVGQAFLPADRGFYAMAARNEFLWAVSDQILSVFKLVRHTESFVVCANRRIAGDVVSLRPTDDLTAMVAFRDGKIAAFEIPNSAAHGMIKQFAGQIPELNVIARFDAGEPLAGLTVLPKSFIYVTEKGGVGGLVPMSSQRDASELMVLQASARARHSEMVGFSMPSRRSVSNCEDVIEGDLLRSYLLSESESRIECHSRAALSRALQIRDF
jgi:hypothetical protein